MLAIVFSGAANFGAMQAGALESLFRHGVKPEMTVGSSAGALNAIYAALNPTPEGARELQAMWKAAGPVEVGVPKALTAIRRLITKKESLVSNEPLARFLQGNLPSEIESYGHLRDLHGVTAYTVAVCVESSKLRVFGDHEDDRLLDGAMASTAIPPYFEPWSVNGERYLDGGVLTKLPIRVAIQRGATQVIAIDVPQLLGGRSEARGVLGISRYAVTMMVEAQTATEIAWARLAGVALRVIRLPSPKEVPFWDYTQPERLIQIGRETTEAELESEPFRRQPDWWLRIRKAVAGLRVRPQSAPPVGEGGG